MRVFMKSHVGRHLVSIYVSRDEISSLNENTIWNHNVTPVWNSHRPVRVFTCKHPLNLRVILDLAKSLFKRIKGAGGQNKYMHWHLHFEAVRKPSLIMNLLSRFLRKRYKNLRTDRSLAISDSRSTNERDSGKSSYLDQQLVLQNLFLYQ